MDENAVVAATCKLLEEQGFKILRCLEPTQHGIDISAENSSANCKVFVEAKGGTSSREGSARFGQAYDSSQVLNRVAKGVFTCLQLRAKYPDRTTYRIMLAVPDSRLFRFYLEPVRVGLEKADIEVIFVTE